ADAPRRLALGGALRDLPVARRVVLEEHPVQAAIGDCPSVQDGEALGAHTRHDLASGAVPGDARPELGELVARVAAREHVEHAVEARSGHLCKRRRRADEGPELLDVRLYRALVVVALLPPPLRRL